MPFYEYECKNCGHALEAMQKVNDAPLKKCPACGKSQLTRLMSAPVFRLKGAGWYETDFKGDQDTKKNLADRPEAEAKDDKPEVKADASDKPDAAGKDGAKPAADPDTAGKPDKGDKAEKADKSDKAGKTEKAAPAVAKKPAGISKRGASAPKKAMKKRATKAKRRA